MNKRNKIGIYTTKYLKTHGITPRKQRVLLKKGSLDRIRQGWYATNDAYPEAVRAVRVGGQLGCISGCKFYGLWIPPGVDEKLHVLRKNTVRSAEENTLQVHYLGGSLREPVAELETCLLDACRFHDVETGMILLESAINLEFLDLTQARNLVEKLPVAKRESFRYLCDRAESGSETRVRLFLQKQRVKVSPQKYICGIGRVDLLVGNRLIIECDSRAHHTQDENYHRDRERDMIAQMLGYQVIRLSYRHIWFDWDRTQAFLHRIIRSRQHRRELHSL